MQRDCVYAIRGKDGKANGAAEKQSVGKKKYDDSFKTADRSAKQGSGTCCRRNQANYIARHVFLRCVHAVSDVDIRRRLLAYAA